MSHGFKQGIFKPANAAKYLGSSYPMYRSGWELKFFRWADLNENIVCWGSENIIVPYINPLDGKVHRYFVDNFVVFKDNKGDKKKFLIEIKPSKQNQVLERRNLPYYMNRQPGLLTKLNGKLLRDGQIKKVIVL